MVDGGGLARGGERLIDDNVDLSNGPLSGDVAPPPRRGNSAESGVSMADRVGETLAAATLAYTAVDAALLFPMGLLALLLALLCAARVRVGATGGVATASTALAADTEPACDGVAPVAASSSGESGGLSRAAEKAISSTISASNGGA